MNFLHLFIKLTLSSSEFDSDRPKRQRRERAVKFRLQLLVMRVATAIAFFHKAFRVNLPIDYLSLQRVFLIYVHRDLEYTENALRSYSVSILLRQESLIYL